MAANAQQEPHQPWSFMPVTALETRQSTERGADTLPSETGNGSGIFVVSGLNAKTAI